MTLQGMFIGPKTLNVSCARPPPFRRRCRNENRLSPDHSIIITRPTQKQADSIAPICHADFFVSKGGGLLADISLRIFRDFVLMGQTPFETKDIWTYTLDRNLWLEDIHYGLNVYRKNCPISLRSPPFCARRTSWSWTKMDIDRQAYSGQNNSLF